MKFSFLYALIKIRNLIPGGRQSGVIGHVWSLKTLSTAELLAKCFRGKVIVFFLEKAPDWNIPEIHFHLTDFVDCVIFG